MGLKLYHKRKRKNVIKADLACNKIEVPKSGVYKIEVFGKNNEIIILNGHPKSNVSLLVHGDNNKVFITTDEEIKLTGIIGLADGLAKNCLFQVGDKTSINGLHFVLMDNNSKIMIGDSCVFSFQIEMWVSDTHTILDAEKNIINMGKEIIVGNHVWVGKEAKILKNSIIPGGGVVGMGSVVAKKFTIPNAIIAGVPAQVVKENISWLKDRPNDYKKEKES